jgi:hypothetical protein
MEEVYKMKGLKQFLEFDLDGFLKDKEITFINSKPYYNYIDGQVSDQVAGMKLECVITKDNTIYNNDEITNEYEKITIKVPRVDKINLKRGAKLKVEGVGKVWGDYSQNLTVEATNIMVSKNDQ